jgi:ABC-2 type transport system ATP-binding protein
MSEYVIKVEDVKKSFFLPHHKNDSLKSAITQMFKPKEKGGNTFSALSGVSFNVQKGDFFGILGRNGSGKSTLLKIISEIYQPSSGRVDHIGKLVSFIELGVGFKTELTGRENVYLNGALLGFSKSEVEAMYEDIVSFAELEKFMDQKLKNYSSGMKVRLAFSVAIRAQADILILDEVLAVGDASFQKKCYDYFKTLKNDKKTVILVTHNMGAVRSYCNKAIVIDKGGVVFEGQADKAADAYLELFEKK